MMRAFRDKSLIIRRAIEERKSRNKLRSNIKLWTELSEYLVKTKSTGCSYSDYWQLYKYVRRRKPVEILECGTGVTTLVMAFALAENELEGHPRGRVTSMEEEEQYLTLAIDLLPLGLEPYVEFILSPTIEDSYSIYRGIRYRDLPQRPYDFVFVDGPRYLSATDNAVTFDLDLITVLMGAEHPVAAIIDKRVSTCYVLQKILGPDRVTYSATHHLGFVKPSTARDLRTIDTKTPSKAFADSFRIFGNCELHLKLYK